MKVKSSIKEQQIQKGRIYESAVQTRENYHNVIMTGKGVEKKYLTQVKAVLFAVISTTSYYRFLGSAPFKSHVVFMVSNLTTCAQKYRRTRNRSGRSGNVFITEACGVSIP